MPLPLFLTDLRDGVGRWRGQHNQRLFTPVQLVFFVFNFFRVLHWPLPITWAYEVAKFVDIIELAFEAQ